MSEAAAAAPADVRKQVLGVTDGKMAMWIFLGSDGMSFMGLIAAYVVLRFNNMGTWPSPSEYLGIQLTAFNTFVLICSSVTMVKAFEGALVNDVPKLKKYLFLTIMGGAAFLGMQVYEYNHFFNNTHSVAPSILGAAAGAETETAFRLALSGIWEGVNEGGHWVFANEKWNEVGGTKAPGSNLFGSTFFVLTAFHGCHVLSGVIYLFFIYIGVCNGSWNKNRIEIVGLYWHFVDLVWIVIFTIVYLVETPPVTA